MRVKTGTSGRGTPRVPPPSGGPGLPGYETIQDEGGSLPQRDILNFIGPAVEGADEPLAVPPRTNVTISAVPGATWNGVRFYAVDYDGGLDTNLGYSDVSMAAAGLVAIKTLEHLRAILPRLGNGQRVVIACKTRAGGAVYRNIANTADDDLFLDNLVGYQGSWVRGTGDVPTAGAVAFSDSAEDRIACGARLVPGTNVAGYNATGVPTVTTFGVQLAGGGAPGLAVEPTLEGKRIRFSSTTVTPALRNVCRMIWANGAATITDDTDLPVAPVPGAAGDVFYIEEPGFAVKNTVTRAVGADNNIPFAAFGAQVNLVGVRSTDATAAQALNSHDGSTLQVAFCEFANTSSASAYLVSTYGFANILSTYITHDGVFVTVGVGLRSAGNLFIANAAGATIANSGIVGANRRFTMGTQASVPVLSLGAGCYCGGVGLRNHLQVSLGNISVASQRFLRTEGTGSGGFVIGLPIGGALGAFVLDGIQTLNAGGSALYRLGQAYNVGVRFKNCIGSVGNTGDGLTLVPGGTVAGCEIMFDTGNTFSGSVGNVIDGNGDLRYNHVDYTLTDFYDQSGNHFQGSQSSGVGPGAFVQQGKIFTSDGTTVLVQYGVAKVGTLTGQMRMAIATTLATATGVMGVRQNFGGANDMIVMGGPVLVEFDAAPTLNAIAYLGKTTAGKATTTVPTVSVTEAKLRLGRVTSVTGTKGIVAWNPDPFPVLADGLA